jgi:hypothetical protein
MQLPAIHHGPASIPLFINSRLRLCSLNYRLRAPIITLFILTLYLTYPFDANMPNLFQRQIDDTELEHQKEHFIQALLHDADSQMSVGRLRSNQELIDALTDAALGGGVDDKQYVVRIVAFDFASFLIQSSKRSSFRFWHRFLMALPSGSWVLEFYYNDSRRAFNIPL